MQSTCTITQKKFTISDKEIQYCQERSLPLPQTSPFERLKHIASFRNRIHLYNTVCALTHKQILSCFPPEKGYTVYDIEAWSGDGWDPMQYAMDYDPSKPFFVQMAELLQKTPIPNLNVVASTMENSSYVNGAMNLKNCYLNFSSLDSTDCMFGWAIFSCHNIVDSVNCYFCELCYGCTDIEKCYNCLFVESSQNCSDSAFLFNCQSCKHCYGCINLNNKEYHWFNQPLSQIEFEDRRKAVNLGNRKILNEEKTKFSSFKQQFPIKYYHGKSIENSSGNYINNMKDSSNNFCSTNCIDVENSLGLHKSKDCFSIISAKGCELTYNSQSGLNYNCQFCNECLVGNRNLQWCMYVNNSVDCFGCISIRKKQYCILNKQYSKDAYEALVPMIIENMRRRSSVLHTGSEGHTGSELNTGPEWEDFYPRKMSPFYYNESDAMIYFPLSQSEAMAQGYSWREEIVEPTIEAGYQAPEDIQSVSDDILKQTLTCTKTGKKYRITKQELDFYRRLNLPIPQVSPLARIATFTTAFFHTEELHTGNCSECKKTLETVYDTSKQKVLCEECYLKVVY